MGTHALRRLLVSATTALTLVCLVPVAGAAPLSHALVIADYAVATASHETPPQVVSALDVNNAVATSRINPTKLGLVANLGQLPGDPRLIVLISSTQYTSTCVRFPSAIDAPPTIVHCPGGLSRSP